MIAVNEGRQATVTKGVSVECRGCLPSARNSCNCGLNDRDGSVCWCSMHGREQESKNTQRQKHRAEVHECNALDGKKLE